MASPLDPRFIGDPSDWLSFQQLQAGTPDIFNISLATLSRTVLFRIGSTNVSKTRKQVSGYNVHFLPIALASPSTLFSLEGQRSAFAVSDIVLTTGAPGPGGVVTASSALLFGKAGYYFAAPVNQAGQESIYFAGPKLAPLPGNVVTAATPPDVSNPSLVVSTQTVNGRSVRRLEFSATVPSNGNGVVAVNVLNPGSGYTYGANPQITFTGSSGSGAVATGIVNANGGLDEVLVGETGAGYITAPVATASPGSAVLEAVVGPSTDFAGYQIYMDGYFGNGLAETQYIAGGNVNFPGSILTGAFYLLPDTPPTGVDIDFYFVSISSTGSRRVNPTSSPVYTLVGGLT